MFSYTGSRITTVKLTTLAHLVFSHKLHFHNIQDTIYIVYNFVVFYKFCH
jgi:hypothetical protein